MGIGGFDAVLEYLRTSYDLKYCCNRMVACLIGLEYFYV